MKLPYGPLIHPTRDATNAMMLQLILNFFKSLAFLFRSPADDLGNEVSRRQKSIPTVRLLELKKKIIYQTSILGGGPS